MNPPPPQRRRRSVNDIVWWTFLVWTTVGFLVLPLGITPDSVAAWAAPTGLSGALSAIVRSSDAIWMLLAAVIAYLDAVANEGLTTARAQAAIILIAATATEWIGTETAFPFGAYAYTANFGPRIAGVVPMAIPLAWLVILLCARRLVSRLWPTASPLLVAALVAIAAVLTDLNLEPVAWRMRHYWVWLPRGEAPPVQNYFAWFGVSFIITLALPVDHSLRRRRPTTVRPATVLLVLNALLAAARLAAFWRLTGG